MRVISACLSAGVALLAAVPCRAQSPNPVRQIILAFDSVARMDLWPGYRPDTIPLAIFDGERTWLVRHPTPPTEFSKSDLGDDVLVMNGRHPEVTANSTAQIGNRLTATMMFKPGAKPRALAAVSAHEAFHAHQRNAHPSWVANEANLFTYPWDNVEALAARRLEFAALRRALQANTTADAACWARVAMADRAARFQRMGPDAATYEIKNELNEGLAQYVQDLAGGVTALDQMPAREFAPNAVRDRVYRSGSALGQLMDRLDRGWKQRLESGDSSVTVDGVLRDALARIDAAPTCTHPASEERLARTQARRDIATLTAQLAADRRAFLAQPGWSVVVEAAGAPLGLQGFDPLNVSRLTSREILHRRYVKLGNDAGQLEAIDRPLLTVGAGPHPLFNGVSRVVVTGLSSAPIVDDSTKAVALHAGEFRLTFTGAAMTRSGRQLIVRLAR